MANEEHGHKPKFDDSILPPSVQEFVKLCKRLIREARTGECGEEEISRVLATANPRIFGYVREEDFVSVDQALKILHLGKNRVKFFELIKDYGITVQTFKGVKVGYLLDEIMRLKYALDNAERTDIPRYHPCYRSAKKRLPVIGEYEKRGQ